MARWRAYGIVAVVGLLSVLGTAAPAHAAYDLATVFTDRPAGGEAPKGQAITLKVCVSNNGPDALPSGFSVTVNKYDHTGQTLIKQIGSPQALPQLGVASPPASGSNQCPSTPAGRTLSFQETEPPAGTFIYKVGITPYFTDSNNTNHRAELGVRFVEAGAAAPMTVSIQAGPPSGWTCPGEANLTATTQGGSTGQTTYQWVIYRMIDGSIVGGTSGNYVTSRSLQWTPPSAGRYRLRVTAKRGTESVMTQVDNYDVIFPITLSVSPASPAAAGSAVTLTAAVPTASCLPPNSPVTYSFGISPGGGGIHQAEPTWTKTGLPNGTYGMYVYAQAKRGDAIWARSDSNVRVTNYQIGGGTTPGVVKFGDTNGMHATFSHAHCVNCHGMAVNATNSVWVAHTPNRLGVNRDVSADVRNNTVSNSANCTTCHGGVSGWRAPRGDGNPNFDFTGLSAAQICTKIKQHMPAASTMSSHLKTDALILWAVTSGTVMGTNLGVAPPGNASDWGSRVDAWVGLSRAAEQQMLCQ